MSKIKVCYIIDQVTAGAGTENQLLQLIRHLDHDRVEPTLVTLTDFDPDQLPSHLQPNCPHFGLGVSGRMLSVAGVWAVLRMARFVMRNRIDIVHTSFLDANLFGVIGGKLGGCEKLVVARRDTGYWHTPGLLFKMRQVNRLADYFLVNAEAIKRVVAEKERFDPARIRVVYNGIFNLPDNSAPKVTRADFGIPKEAPLVGIVANLRPVKRLDHFLTAAASLKDKNSRFMIVGIGSLKNELLEMAREKGIADRLTITHTLDNIYDYYKMFDIGVLTSDSEGLSNTLVECQLCGKPSVAFDVGGNDEIISDGETGYLVAKGDVTTMSHRIDQLLADKELRSNMGVRAAERTRSLFDGKRMVEQTTAFYYEILGK